jgi:hypothetical protein
MTPGSEAEGLAFTAAAVLLFAVFTVPTKTSVVADGMFFQLLMCAGIYCVGATAYLVQCATSCPHLEPLSMVGGAIWTTSNLLLCPLVGAQGVGMTMTAWGMAEMLTGWGTGRFGLLGLEKEAVANPGENAAGVALALAAVVVLGFTQSAVSEVAAVPAPRPAGGDESETTGLLATKDLESGTAPSSSLKSGLQDAEFAANGYDFVRYLSPAGKRTFGFIGSLLAGVLSGSTFTPIQFMIDANARAVGAAPFPGASSALLDHVFGHFSGILLSSVLFFGLYAASTARARGPWVSSALVGPALVSGVVWGCAMLSWFMANEKLSLVIAFPLVTVGPGLLMLIVGALVWREVHGRRNLALLALASALFSAAAALIAHSGGGA